MEVDPTLRTIIAKAVLWCASQLSRMKTWQRTYEWVADRPVTFRPAGRIWSSCVASHRLMELSARIDPRHWEHWALVHDECQASPCHACGGCRCV